MQDIEFTIERGKLYMLQTRNGKRTGAAAVKIAVDMVKEKLIDEKTRAARARQRPDAAAAAPASTRSRQEEARSDRHGPAGLARRRGRQARLHRRGSRRSARRPARRCCSSARRPAPRTSTACTSAAGILTSTGGMTSHAAVVARGWGKCCVAGAGAISIDAKKRKVTVNGKTYSPRTPSPSTARPAR
jgi:pyruvate, orthophosphate dikinase